MKFDIKILLVLWLALFFSSDIPGIIETKLFPVIKNVSVSVNSTDNTLKSDLYLEFEKIRGNCEFEDIKFYMIGNMSDGDTMKTLVSYVNNSPAVVREEGLHKAGPWTLNTSKFFLRFITMEIRHRCHPFWETISTFDRIGSGMH